MKTILEYFLIVLLVLATPVIIGLIGNDYRCAFKHIQPQQCHIELLKALHVQ